MTEDFGKRIHDLEISHEHLKSELHGVTVKVDGLAKTNSEQHSELKGLFGKMQNSVDTVVKDYHERMGAKKAKGFWLPLSVSFIGIIAGVLATYIAIT